MTVVVAVKVFDGLVLAADSATTINITEPMPDGVRIADRQVYNNADKVFQLHRNLPIGMAIWGAGQIGDASISSLAKDLRRRLMGRDPEFPWTLDTANYSVQEVGWRIVELMYDELYSQISPKQAAFVGFLVAGYSSGERHPEAWQISLEDPGKRPEPLLVITKDRVTWHVTGQPQAVGRLLLGYTQDLRPGLEGLVDPARRDELVEELGKVERPVALAAMPFADAIRLATFLVDTTIGFTRFAPGSDTVGGPVDVAGISRHEGFRWVQRKHYYPSELNPRRPHDHDWEQHGHRGNVGNPGDPT